jgi:hypothetical protein
MLRPVLYANESSMSDGKKDGVVCVQRKESAVVRLHRVQRSQANVEPGRLAGCISCVGQKRSISRLSRGSNLIFLARL